MAEILSSSWSESADQNNANPPDGWPEGMERRAVNNTAREMMAAIKRFANRMLPTRASSSGGAATYEVTYTSNPTSYEQGLTIAFRAHAACGDNATLKVGALSPILLRKPIPGGNGPVRANDISAGNIVIAMYDSVASGFVITSSLAPGTTTGGGGGGGTTVNAFTGEIRTTASRLPIPAGWLACDGAAVSRTTYSSLFAAIGTTYGTGNGSTTFNVPDARGRALIGANGFAHSGYVGAAEERVPGADFPGWDGGAAEHQLLVQELPGHSHAGSTGSAGDHTHSGSTAGVGDHAHSGATDGGGLHLHTGSAALAGAHNHNTLRMVIAEGGTGMAYGAGAFSGQIVGTTFQEAHTHLISMDYAGQHAHNITTHGAGAHSHTMSLNTAGAHTHPITTAAAGGNVPHPIVQPSLAVNVIIFTGIF